MAMSFGIHIGHMGGPLEEMRRLWKFADSAGFDWFSVSDHFQESPPRGGDIECFEAISTLTAAAVETSRVRLGALVYCVAYRNPGLHAKSLQRRVPIWIGGRGEKRTLLAAAKFVDGWNAPYIGPEEWIAKGKVLDRWCETEGRDPRTIARTVNLGFYLGADAKGAARGEQTFQSHFGKDPRDGFLRGTPKEMLPMLTRFRDAGCARVNIAFREGPYDWDALHAFAETVFPVFGVRRPT